MKNDEELKHYLMDGGIDGVQWILISEIIKIIDLPVGNSRSWMYLCQPECREKLKGVIGAERHFATWLGYNLNNIVLKGEALGKAEVMDTRTPPILSDNVLIIVRLNGYTNITEYRCQNH